MDEMDDIKLLKAKAQIFFEKNIAVHLDLKKNDGFLNGVITEISADFFMMNEFKLKEMPVFYSEIELIEPYEYKKKEVEHG